MFGELEQQAPGWGTGASHPVFLGGRVIALPLPPPSGSPISGSQGRCKASISAFPTKSQPCETPGPPYLSSASHAARPMRVGVAVACGKSEGPP